MGGNLVLLVSQWVVHGFSLVLLFDLVVVHNLNVCGFGWFSSSSLWREHLEVLFVGQVWKRQILLTLLWSNFISF